MFINESLQDHLETSSTIRTQSAVIAEWNMNSADNIAKIGNYRFRPLDQDSKYRTLANVYDESDTGYFYTKATDADTIVDGGLKDDGTPQSFLSKKEKEGQIYSLEDCFYKFRPRSGINKARYFDSKFSHHVNEDMSERPRYYISDIRDKFKYWTSYRTETLYKYIYPTYVSFGAEATYSYRDANDVLIVAPGEPVANTERGISNRQIGDSGTYYIDDTAPFVVYKEQIPANRIVIKTQTNVGTVNLGPFANSSGLVSDPFFGYQNQTTPVKWKIQYLENNNWVDAISFDKNSIRKDGSQVIGPDGYIEVGYGLVVPTKYRSIFYKSGELYSETLLPDSPANGSAYLVKTSDTVLGTYYIYVNGDYESFVPTYGWYLVDDNQDSLTNHAIDLTSPTQFRSSIDGRLYYREFSYISGLRVVIESMNTNESSFDLIELSPRLTVDLADKVTDFSITKIASDLGVSGMPVSQLLASTGNLNLFDFDEAFNENNLNSIVRKHLTKNIQVKFYEIVSTVPNDEYDDLFIDYYVPIKTMYSEGFPEVESESRTVSLNLRDLYFYLESMTAPQLLMQEASVSSAVSTLLDSIGFSNYTFKRVPGEKLEVIPYFFIAPDKTVAQVLNDIAISTQSAMFFDEENNLITMSRNYMMPALDERPIDMTLYGSADSQDSGVLENEQTVSKLSNIIEISSQDNIVYNDGQINYTARSIERSYGSIAQASLVDRNKTWIYKPVLLWEVSGTEATKSTGGEIENQSSYVLGAIPLNSDLSDIVPSVRDYRIIDNTIDLGEGIYWITRYNGYFYANGEIVKYDAVQFNIPGISIMDPTNPNVEGNNVWITSTKEYQNYFSKLPFNGKIYPTGLVRIFSEPNYENVGGDTRLKNGVVARHGRGQFGTPVVFHNAGLSSHWSNVNNVRGLSMSSTYLFNDIIRKIDLSGASSSGTTVTVPNVSLVKKNQLVSVWDEASSSYVSIVKDSKVKVTAVNEVPSPSTGLYSFTVSLAPTAALNNSRIQLTDDPLVESGNAGTTVNLGGTVTESKVLAQKSTRNGIIRNFLSNSYTSETDLGTKTKASVESGTMQSSALVITGPAMSNNYRPIDFLSYVYKPLENRFKHFGTRVRIIGRVEDSSTKVQSPFGSTEYFNVTGIAAAQNNTTSRPDQNVTISGSSGGIAVMVNPETNQGYYFEIIALSEADVESYATESDVHNVVFYKVMKDADSESAIPVKLWGGLAQILVDDGNFTGQHRLTGEETPTVYDLSVEYRDIGSTRRFYLYINDKLVSIVDDETPLEIYNNMALFVRGAARCMFENVFAIAENYSQTTSFSIDNPISSTFQDTNIGSNESFRKYALSGVVKSGYLSGISSAQSPKYNMYFEEFGTIMREAAYFNFRYDKAYPALAAKLSPTFNRIQGYTVSGFIAGSYGAEFLIFNSTDTAISLDSTSGNYLRIQGVTFTQESENQLTIEDYFSKRSDFSNPQFSEAVIGELGEQYNITDVTNQLNTYRDLKNSRMAYGKNEFSLDTPYIQSFDDASDLMGWIISKIMKPRKSIGIKLFAMPTLQLGDIVNIDFSGNNIAGVAPVTSRFSVYNIQYEKSIDGPSMTVYLSEVV